MSEGIRPLLALLLALFLGCAETARIPRPQDFPMHASNHPFFDLHWRLERTEKEVRAVGLVEAARVDQVGAVTVELQEIDASGRVISRAMGQTYGGRLDMWESRPFEVDLRPRGTGDRFEVRVWSFSWAVGFGSGH